jgi:hypothetical protein
MSQVNQFKLPDVGEGLADAEIVAWRVRGGDMVAVNDTVVEVETAKSIVELPSPYAGQVLAFARLRRANGRRGRAPHQHWRPRSYDCRGASRN